jgi:hypothetical protein
VQRFCCCCVSKVATVTKIIFFIVFVLMRVSTPLNRTAPQYLKTSSTDDSRHVSNMLPFHPLVPQNFNTSSTWSTGFLRFPSCKYERFPSCKYPLPKCRSFELVVLVWRDPRFRSCKDFAKVSLLCVGCGMLVWWRPMKVPHNSRPGTLSKASKALHLFG